MDTQSEKEGRWGVLGDSFEALLQVLGMRSSRGRPAPAEQIELLLKEGAASGLFTEAEREMVRRVFRLCHHRARTLMTPMKEIVWLHVSETPDEMREKIKSSPHSRFPVCDGSIDNILGVVQVKDLLLQSYRGEPFGIKGLLRLPLFIYEATAGLKVLEQFKTTGTHIAVVIDEFGSILGLLTLNDILKAIVGELPTGVDPREPRAVLRADGSWLVDGMLTLDEFEDEIGPPRLPRGDYHTLAGFMVTHLGRIPRVSERFEWGGLTFEVVDLDGHRVDKILVSPARGS
jgi:putative hemolysin